MTTERASSASTNAPSHQGDQPQIDRSTVVDASRLADELTAMSARIESLEGRDRTADSLHTEMERLARAGEALLQRVETLEDGGRRADSLHAEMGRLAAAGETLSERVESLEIDGGRIDELSTRIDEARASVNGTPRDRQGHWARLIDGAALTTLLGVIVSIAIFWAQGRNEAANDERQALAELARITTRLSEIGAEVAVAGATNPETAGIQSIAGNTEQGVLLGQFERIQADYSRIARSLDLQIVGEAYTRSNDPATGVELIRESLELAADEVSEQDRSATWYSRYVSGQRGIGQALFQLERFDEARAAFALALDPGEDLDFATVPPIVRESADFQTLFLWVDAEASSGHCDVALNHFEDLEARVRVSERPWLYGTDRPFGLMLQNARLVLPTCVPVQR